MLANILKGATSIAVPILAFGSGAVDLNNISSYTFSGMSIGTAASNRYVVVAAQCRGPGILEGFTCTVGGQSCTTIGPLINNNNNTHSYFFVTTAPLTTGTTATVVINYPMLGSACRLATYALYTTNPTPSFTAADNSRTNPLSVNSPLSTGQVGIALGSGGTSSSFSSISVSGPVTPNYNSGPAEFSAIVVSTITGSGTITYSTVGSGSVASSMLATWG